MLCAVQCCVISAFIITLSRGLRVSRIQDFQTALANSVYKLKSTQQYSTQQEEIEAILYNWRDRGATHVTLHCLNPSALLALQHPLYINQALRIILEWSSEAIYFQHISLS